VVLDPPSPYRIVDLSTGVISEANSMPDLLTNADYKTTKLVLKRIPAGTFTMGDEVNVDVYPDEEPEHTVNITQDYWMGVFEVTQAQWEMITTSNPSYFIGQPDSPRRPVEQVSWDDCQAYLTLLSSLTGATFRLPTEAEWELVGKAGTSNNYSYGASADGAYMWYDANSDTGSGMETHEVGTKLANPWGLYDMHGNVVEWTMDWYDAAYYSVSAADNPPGPASGTYKSCRGGSYGSSADGYCRTSARDNAQPAVTMSGGGFRAVLDPTP
jgi:formylglycine-generating enzyme required for sulfatase activity